MNTPQMSAPLPAPYPVDALPKILREAFFEVCKNLQAPESLIAASFFAAISATSQSTVKVLHPFTGQIKPTALFLLTIANSGERKTAVERVVCAPLYDIDERREHDFQVQAKHFAQAHRRWVAITRELQKRISRSICDGLSTDVLDQQLAEHERAEPPKPRLSRFILQDTSERAFLDALEGQGQSLAIMGDEGDIIFSSPLFARNGVINKAWDGGPLILTRAQGVNFSARDTRVTLSIMVQEDVFRAFSEKKGSTSRGCGLFARFLIAWPKSTQGFRYNQPGEISWPNLEAFHRRIREMLTESMQFSSEQAPTTVFELDTDAIEHFRKITNGIEFYIGPSQYLHDIADAASKVGENILRVAALFHHFSEQTGKISRDTIDRAWQVVHFHLGEYKLLFSEECEVPQFIRDSQLLIRYLHRVVWSLGCLEIARTEVQHSGPLRNQLGRFNAALDHLQAIGVLTVIRKQNSIKRHILLNWAYFNELGSYITSAV